MNAVSTIHCAKAGSSALDRETLGRHHLSPAQQKAFDEIMELSSVVTVCAIESAPGLGKSSICRVIADSFQAELIGWDDFVTHVAQRPSDSAEDSMLIAMEEALVRSDLVIVDALEALIDYRGRYNSAHFLLKSIAEKARLLGKRMIFAGEKAFASFNRSPGELMRVQIDALDAADYACILTNMLGKDRVANLDCALLHRAAPMLNGHDLRTLGGLLLDSEAPTAEEAIALVEGMIIECNTDISEVEELTFSDLPGTEAIAELLDTHVILPLTNKKLAAQLGLKPKRGVLLYGPPGTGKTSVGRALAHKMKGRLHLIDGSFITEPPIAFFNKVRTIVQEAKDSAPCVLFVDDADVLFGIEHISGLSRYLLSLLDGVESETAGKVCVMMTAMNVSKIPAAIMRSGRVELWLETRTPDASTRAAILKKWLGTNFPASDRIDFQKLSVLAENFTPADLRRVVGDARTFLAAAVISGSVVSNSETYLERAISELIGTRDRMADNLRDESLRIGTISSKAKYGQGIGGVVEAETSCTVKGW